MKTRSTRALNSVSPEEMERRWAAVRGAMRARRIDALVVQNSSDWVGGYIRWFSNQPATNGYPSSVVFPLEGGMSFIEQGPFGGLKESSPDEFAASGIARRLTTPSYPSVGYSGAYDAEIAAVAGDDRMEHGPHAAAIGIHFGDQRVEQERRVIVHRDEHAVVFLVGRILVARREQSDFAFAHEVAFPTARKFDAT